MSLNVIDISSYQEVLNLQHINYDGVAIKATEGTGYVNPDCDKHYQQAKAQGKKRAVYHFFTFGVDPIAQANYFVDNCIGYIHDAIFILDWEGSGVGNVSEALTFLRQVEARIGYKPAIYMSQWVENSYNWTPVVQSNIGLWIARYSNWELANHAHDWDMSQAGQAPVIVYWPFYFMWQWTSTGLLSGYAANLDCDIAYLTGDQWDKYAGIRAAQPAPPAPPTTTVPPVVTTLPAPTTASPTTTVPAPQPPAPTTTDTTTVAADHPVNPQPTPPTPSETTTTTAAPQTRPAQPSWLDIIWSIFIAIIERLRGKPL